MADLQLVVRAIGRDELSGPFSVSEQAIGRLGAASGAAGVAVAGLTIGLAALGAAAGVSAVGMAKAAQEAGNLQQAVANVASIKPDIDTSAVFSSLNLMQTRVAQSKEQLDASLYDLFSSFEATQADALATVEKFGRGAVAAQTDAQTFGTAVLGVINAYGGTLADVEHVQDVFFNTVNKGVVTGRELAASLGLVTQQAKNAGLSVEQLGAYIAAVTKEGGPAAQNINNLANYLAKVNTKEAAQGFELLGVKTVEANGKLRDNIAVLTDLRTRLSQLNQVSASKALQELFPDFQARTGVTVLLNQLDFLKDSLKENETEAGSAARAYETMAATFNTEGQLLQQSINSVFTSGGNALLPVLQAAVQGVQRFVADTAPQFDAWQQRINDAFTADGFQGWLTEVGKVAGELGEEISNKWLPEMTAWLEPAKEQLGTTLNTVWTGTIEPWIGEQAEKLGKKFEEDWAPKLADWIDTKAQPVIIQKLDETADRVLKWAETDGAKKFEAAGAQLGLALLKRITLPGVALGTLEEVANNLQAGRSRVTPNAQDRAAGYPGLAEGTPTSSNTIESGGMVVLQSDAEARLAAANEATRIYQQGQQAEQQALAARAEQDRMAAEAVSGNGSTGRTGSGIGTGTEDVDLAALAKAQEKAQRDAEAAANKAKRDAEAAIRKAQAEAQRLAEQYAAMVAGFDRIADEGIASLNQRFGDEAKANIALQAALVAGAGQAQGQALASAILDLAKEGRKAGVPEIEALYRDAMAAGRRAIVEGGEANKQAAIASINALGEAVRAQNTLTPETWKNALGISQAIDAMGSAGASLWENFRKASEEGGRETIDQLARQRSSMARSLFENRDLSPEQAREFVTELFGALDNAIQNRGPESAANLQQVLTRLNFDVPAEAARNRRDQRIAEAEGVRDVARAQAEMNRDQQIATLRAQRGEQEYRAQYLQGLQDEHRASLEVLASVDRAVRASTQQRREDRDRRVQYEREDADQEIARAQQVEDAKARIRQAHDPKHDPIQAKGTTFGFSTTSDMDNELKALERQFAREDAIKATRRARDQEDVNQRRQDQNDDIAWANQYAGLLQTATDKFNTARDSFTKAASNADFNNQILAIQASADTTITKAEEAYTKSVAAAKEDYNRVVGMLNAMRELAGIGATALDPTVKAAEQTRDYLREAAGYLGQAASQAAANGGSATPASTNPVESPPSDLPGFATGGSFTVGGSGGTDSQRVAFRATPGERVTIGGGGTSGRNLTDADIAALAAAISKIHIDLDGQQVAKIVTSNQNKRNEQTLTYPSGFGMNQNGVGGVGQGGY